MTPSKKDVYQSVESTLKFVNLESMSNRASNQDYIALSQRQQGILMNSEIDTDTIRGDTCGESICGELRSG